MELEKLNTLRGVLPVLKYEIKDNSDQIVLYARVSLNTEPLQYRTTVPFNIMVFDEQGLELISISRPLKYAWCWCFCCLQQLVISDPLGNVISTIEQNASFIFIKLSVKNASGDIMLKIKNKANIREHQYGIVFNIMSLDGKVVGSIKRARIIKPVINTYFSTLFVNFPMDLDVKMKAAIIGATLLIVSTFLIKFS